MHRYVMARSSRERTIQKGESSTPRDLCQLHTKVVLTCILKTNCMILRETKKQATKLERRPILRDHHKPSSTSIRELTINTLKVIKQQKTIALCRTGRAQVNRLIFATRLI